MIYCKVSKVYFLFWSIEHVRKVWSRVSETPCIYIVIYSKVF